MARHGKGFGEQRNGRAAPYLIERQQEPTLLWSYVHGSTGVFRRIRVRLLRKNQGGKNEGNEISDQQAELLADIHFRKMDMSDEIFVIDVDGYIGSSTKKEIEYAKEHGITVRYYSKSEITDQMIVELFT